MSELSLRRIHMFNRRSTALAAATFLGMAASSFAEGPSQIFIA